MTRHRFRPSAPAAAIPLIAALVLALGACAPGRALEAKRLLDTLAERLAAAEAGAEPPGGGRRRIAYTVAGRPREADLYVPARPTAAGLVLVPGATPAGRDDPRLVALATTLAEARFLVLVPRIPGLRAYRLSPGHAAPVADAVVHLAGRTGPANDGGGRVAVMAVSYAVGPAVLAALQPAARPHVGVLVTVGGYHDVTRALTYVITGCHSPPSREGWTCRAHDRRGVWLFARSNADRLASATDRRRLRRIAERRLDDPGADVTDLAAGLGPDGRAVYALLTTRDPERIPARIDALPESLRRPVLGLDLARRDLTALPARLIAVHGRDDPVIPYGQSVALARAFGDGARLYVVDELAHVGPAGPGLGDAVTLWRAAYRVLSERGTLPAPQVSPTSDRPGRL